jgi:magnesium transporter
MLASDDRSGLAEICTENHPSLVADMIGSLESREIWQIIGPLSPGPRAEVFAYLEPATQLDVVERIGRKQLAALMDGMESDDRADFFKRLDEHVAKEMLPLMARAEREDLKRLVQAEEGTVAAVMNTDYVHLPPDITAAEALVRVRQQAPDRETIDYAYVVDEQRRLLGFVSLKDIILARPDRKLREVMRDQVISVSVGADQEDAAAAIEEFDLVAVPVVDADKKLVGIVTHDDALDIVREEEGEDLEHFMGLTGPTQEVPYLEVPFWVHFRRRVIWLVALLVVGYLSTILLHGYERLPFYEALSIYIPMLVMTGGNAGQQSVTTVMRALILEEIKPNNFLGVVVRELGASAMLSAAVAAVVYVAVHYLGATETGPGVGDLAMIVTLAMTVHVMVSAVIGASLPLMARWVKLDPTVIASPALTTLADVTGLVIFFNLASWVLL